MVPIKNLSKVNWGYSDRVVTLSPPTSEARVWFMALPQVGKLVTPVGQQCKVQNLEQLYMLFSAGRPTTRYDMICTVLKVM